MLNGTSLRAVVMDLDGVIWRGSRVLPGAAAWLDMLRERSIPFVLATNNSSRSPADYVTKFADLGLGRIEAAQVITSGVVAVDHLRTHYPPGSPIHVLGGDGLKALIDAAGFVRVDHAPAAVVVGIDFELTYARLKQAALLIRAGAHFIGTNADATFPTPDGLAPGAGSLLAALHTATGIAPLIMGKPNPAMFRSALTHLGSDPAHTLMIGDRLDTDIAGAQAIGMPTALVLTGVTEQDVLDAAPHVHADVVVSGLPELHSAWLAALPG